MNISLHELRQEIHQVVEQLKASNLLLPEIGKQAVESVHKNFDEQGRPIKWVPSQAALRENRKTLIDTRALYESITYDVNGNTISVGSNIPYAKKMNEFREYLLLQDEDMDNIEKMILDKILESLS